MLAGSVALAVNYSFNHAWSFSVQGQLRRRLPRYGLLIGLNLAITLSLVAGLTAIGVFHAVAKSVAVALS